MRTIRCSLLFGLWMCLSLTAVADISSSGKDREDSSIVGSWHESQHYELTCWQDGQQILSEKGAGSVVLGDEILRSSITIRAPEHGGETVMVVGMQRALCRMKGR